MYLKSLNVKLKVTVGQSTLIIKLHDNPTVNDFVSLLPLTVDLSDYNKTEMIGNIPRKLSIDKAPAGYQPRAGDLTYYAPWGNLALFYKPFRYSNGLIVLGQVENGIDVMSNVESVNVQIELLK